VNVRIVEVQRTRNGASGNFLTTGRNSARITISLALNRGMHEYAATLLHELLHLWVTMMRVKGLRVSNIREHRFIYAAEVVVAHLARRFMRRKGVRHGQH
jgi:antirestriction protein ArdC